jgi:hypothetical protein
MRITSQIKLRSYIPNILNILLKVPFYTFYFINVLEVHCFVQLAYKIIKNAILNVYSMLGTGIFFVFCCNSSPNPQLI